MLKNTTKTLRGYMHFFNDIPADFIASNSFFSPMFPKVIIDESKIDIGSAKGINLAEA